MVLVLLLATLTAAERRAVEPLFDLSCFRRRNFSASVLSLALAFVTGYLLTFVLPFWLMEARHQSPSGVGRLLAFYATTRLSVAWLSGRWSDRVDSRWFTIPGMLMFACGLSVLSHANDENLI